MLINIRLWRESLARMSGVQLKNDHTISLRST
jgi:hypothetical protein